MTARYKQIYLRGGPTTFPFGEVGISIVADGFVLRLAIHRSKEPMIVEFERMTPRMHPTAWVAAAGSVVGGGAEIPSSNRVAGASAKVTNEFGGDALDWFSRNAPHFVDLPRHHREPGRSASGPAVG